MICLLFEKLYSNFGGRVILSQFINQWLHMACIEVGLKAYQNKCAQSPAHEQKKSLHSFRNCSCICNYTVTFSFKYFLVKVFQFFSIMALLLRNI